MKLRALDLFCCAGGATKGLQRAGFHVTGVDVKPQPRYCGDKFLLGDALTLGDHVHWLRTFDFIWASPPCQAFTALRHMPTAKAHPNLIPQTRDLLLKAGVPYCIENVEFAPLGRGVSLIVLCGTMFGLQTADGRAELRRHRLFETSFSIPLRPACQHGYCSDESLSVTGNGLDSNKQRWAARRILTVTGHTPVDNKRTAISVAGSGLPRGSRRAITVTGSTPQTNTVRNTVRETFTVAQAREAMGIDWMGMRGLSQAVPPAYSEFIVRQWLNLYYEAEADASKR